MDKQTESRSIFESWYEDETGWDVSEAPDHDVTELLWMAWEKAWTASRESLVVALPKREAFESYPHESYMIDDDNGKYIPYTETVNALRAIGIRIKGEGDGASS